jgi:hypothetical protein
MVTFTTTNSCGSVVVVDTLTINPAPVAATLTGATEVCQGASITIAASITGGTWTSTTGAATVVGGVVTGMTGGSTMISYMTGNSCGNAYVSETITVNPLPDPGSISGIDSVCAGEVIILTDGAIGGSWTSTNTSIATVSGGTVSGVATGITTISYAISNSCGTQSATKVVFVKPASECKTGVTTFISHNDGMSIYPNPTSGDFIIDVPATGKVVSVQITDIAGQTIRQWMPDMNNTTHKVPVTLTNLASGTYMVKVVVDGMVYRQKIEVL